MGAFLNDSKKLENELVKDELFQEAIDLIKKELTPLRILFFGSRANFKYHKNSDYDFVVVVPDTFIDPYKESLRLRRILSKKSIIADIFIYKENDFNDWKNEFSSIPETALSTGFEVSIL